MGNRIETRYTRTDGDIIATITARDDTGYTVKGEGRVPLSRWDSDQTARAAAQLKAALDIIETALARLSIEHMDVPTPEPTLTDILTTHFGVTFPDDDVKVSIDSMFDLETDEDEDEDEDEEADYDARCQYGCCLNDEEEDCENNEGESIEEWWERFERATGFRFLGREKEELD